MFNGFPRPKKDNVSGALVGLTIVTAGTNLLINNAASASILTTDTAVYGKKLKETRVNVGGVIRTAFTIDQNNSTANATHAKVYINGIARGLARDGANGSDSNPITYTEDFAVNVSDLVQIYGYTVSASYEALVYDFKISVAESPEYCTSNI